MLPKYSKCRYLFVYLSSCQKHMDDYRVRVTKS